MRDEVQSILGELVQKTNLFILCLGILIIVLVSMDGTQVGDFSLSIQQNDRKILLPIAFILIGIGIFLSLKNSTERQRNSGTQNQFSASASQEKIEEYEKKVKEQESLIAALHEVAFEIREIVLRDSNNPSSIKILHALEKLGIAINKYEKNTNMAFLTAKWFLERKDGWLSSIRKEDYPRLKSVDIEAFRSSISQCLDLIEKNLIEGTHTSPNWAGIKLTNASPFVYKAVFDKIKKSINEELDCQPSPEILNSQRQELLDCIEQMAKDVTLKLSLDQN
jgi:hypothetical protein